MGFLTGYVLGSSAHSGDRDEGIQEGQKAGYCAALADIQTGHHDLVLTKQEQVVWGQCISHPVPASSGAAIEYPRTPSTHKAGQYPGAGAFDYMSLGLLIAIAIAAWGISRL